MYDDVSGPTLDEPPQPFERAIPRDKDLVHRINAQLQIDLGQQVRDFRVTTRNHGLILQGRIHSYYGKLLTQQVAMEVSGLGVVANEITVF
ncbi:MAG: BON domain-containing protein [Planctomycetaceae bacterium]